MPNNMIINQSINHSHWKRIIEKTSNIIRFKNHRNYFYSILFFTLTMLVVYMFWFHYNPQSFGLQYMTEQEIADAISKDSSFQYQDPGNKGVNGFYFWATTTSTVGYGDITPRTSAARMITSVYQIFLAWVSFGLFFFIATQGLKGFILDAKRIMPSYN